MRKQLSQINLKDLFKIDDKEKAYRQKEYEMIHEDYEGVDFLAAAVRDQLTRSDMISYMALKKKSKDTSHSNLIMKASL